MRKLIFGINISIDGCCDHTKMTGSEDIHYYFADRLKEVDTIIYGRKIYDLMVPFWPDIAKNNSGPTQSMNDFAKAFDSVPQIVVFSRTMEKADHKKTVIARGDLETEIMKLKKAPGRAISIGGVDLASQVIKLGLVDEYNIVIQPKIIGEGRRFMEDVILVEKPHLKLVDTIILPSGSIALHYAK